MCRAIGVEPTKLTALIRGSSRIRSTVSRSPLTTLSTPSGRPASRKASASHRAAEGTFSLGLRMTVLPAAMAVVTIHSGTMAGKLNGVMQATTPTGWRSWVTSTPVEACSRVSPFMWWTRPAQNSTFSRPRVISPSASSRTLPCSAVMIAASSPRRAVMIWRRLNMMFARLAMPVDRQAGAAVSAASTAVVRVAASARGTWPVWTPVAGLYTGLVRSPAVEASPPMKWWSVAMLSRVLVMSRPSGLVRQWFHQGHYGRFRRPSGAGVWHS